MKKSTQANHKILFPSLMALVFTVAANAPGDVIFTQNLDNPANPVYQTYALDDDGNAESNRGRDLRADGSNSRAPGQTFQLSQDIVVQSLWVHYNPLDTTNTRTFTMAIYEVDDIKDSGFTAGDLMKSVDITTTLTSTGGEFRFFSVEFTGTDVFTLGARGDGETDPAGYVLALISDDNTSNFFNLRGNSVANFSYGDGQAYNDTGLGGESVNIPSTVEAWNFAIIPEPSTLVLLGLTGIAAVLGLRRRRA